MTESNQKLYEYLDYSIQFTSRLFNKYDELLVSNYRAYTKSHKELQEEVDSLKAELAVLKGENNQ